MVTGNNQPISFVTDLDRTDARYVEQTVISVPAYTVDFCMDMKGGIYKINIDPYYRTDGESKRYEASHMEDLPSEYRSVTLLKSCVTPNWLLYLFDIDFNLSEPERFYPAVPGIDYAPILQTYTDIVEKVLAKEREKGKES